MTPAEKLCDVGEALLDSELIRKLVGRARRRVGDGDQIGIGQAADDALAVERADASGADEGDAKGVSS